LHLHLGAAEEEKEFVDHVWLLWEQFMRKTRVHFSTLPSRKRRNKLTVFSREFNSVQGLELLKSVQNYSLILDLSAWLRHTKKSIFLRYICQLENLLNVTYCDKMTAEGTVGAPTFCLRPVSKADAEGRLGTTIPTYPITFWRIFLLNGFP
jgi:hypothetical protein